VVVVDVHEILRESLSRLLASSGHFVVTGEAPDGEKAAAVCAAARPQVVLMDLSMPVLDGVAATRLILSRQPEIRVVVLTSFCDRDHVRDALAAGAIGYLLKDTDPEQLVAAVRSAAAGNRPLDPRVEALLAPTASTSGSVPPQSR
jgi:DNA-binding NarL/FixJ family response regulator